MITFLLFLVDLNPPEIVSLVNRGLDYAYVEKYQEAEVFFDSVIYLFPDNPAGYFFKAALIELYFMDTYNYDRDAEFFAYVDTTIIKAKKILKEEKDGWAQFYFASAHIYRAVYEGFKRNYWNAFRHGVKGGSEIKKVLTFDSTIYDAYLGIGVYEYFWATASRYLPILKLFGNWEDGVQKIEVAKDSGLYSSVTAMNALSWIMSNEGRGEEGLVYAETLAARYPSSRVFKWSLGRAYLAIEKYDEALSVYRGLYDYYLTSQPENRTNIAQVNLDIARCYVGMGRDDEALELIDGILKTPEFNNNMKKIIDDAKKLKKEIKK